MESANRFVVLEHDHPYPHWDLMLQDGAVLRSWRLERLPMPNDRLEAMALPDHRLAYLDYEGPVSGGRGFVRRCRRGILEWLRREADVVEARWRDATSQGSIHLQKAGSAWVARWQEEPVFDAGAGCAALPGDARRGTC